jgi:pilus assembly protein Flp/PilA
LGPAKEGSALERAVPPLAASAQEGRDFPLVLNRERVNMLSVVMQRVLAVFGDRKGVTALEYGVLAAAIIAVVAATVFAIGTKLNDAFTTVQNQL